MASEAVGVEQRIAAAVARAARLSGGGERVSVARLCRELGIRRPTFSKYENRFRERGLAGILEPASRRPRRSPGQIPARLEDLIATLRKELGEDGWDAGARTIRWHLPKRMAADPDLAGVRLPAVATVHRALRRRGLVVDDPRKRPRTAPVRFEYATPNACWQIDALEWHLACGRAVAIVQILDDHSRLLLTQLACPAETGSAVWQALEVAIDRHGLPGQVLTDRGGAMLGPPSWQTLVRRNLTALGVTCVTSRGNRPQTCGKNERVHQTLQQWLRARHPAVDLPDLQVLLDTFEVGYNHSRPHQSLAMTTPAQRYAASPKHQPDTDPAATALIVATNQVTSRGTISLAGPWNAHLGRQWEGCQLTVMRTGLQVSLFYRNEHLRDLTIDPTRRYQSTGQPNNTSRQRARVRIKTIGTCK
jgi:transposase InsO family protein